MTTDWKTGDIVTLQRIDKMLKKNRTTAYKELVSSRYVCIREASNDQRGILHINTEATFWVRGTNEVLEYQTSNLCVRGYGEGNQRLVPNHQHCRHSAKHARNTQRCLFGPVCNLGKGRI